MAREDLKGRGLPSPEVRRQILQQAGTILEKARDLMALLDGQGTLDPARVPETQYPLERTAQPHHLFPQNNPAYSREATLRPSSRDDHALSA
jgi:hypothetical protein